MCGGSQAGWLAGWLVGMLIITLDGTSAQAAGLVERLESAILADLEIPGLAGCLARMFTGFLLGLLVLSKN